MAVRTDWLVASLIALAATARADSNDADIIGRDPGWRIEDVELRTSYLEQHGHGFQAQGAPPGEPGSEYMWILEPWARIVVRQNARIVHEITVPVDAITAASPDAVDATTSASLRQISTDVDLRTTYQYSEHDTLTTRFVGHHEEPLSSGTAGAGWRRSFADDNATLAINGAITIDGFDHHDHFGHFLGKTARETANVNLTGSQLLSPTTVLDGGYGVTAEHGTMDIGWNAVPAADGSLTDEVLPRDRLRHALSIRVAQHVPATRSTVKAWYRFYIDDWGLLAHTIEVDVYQYLVDWLYVRGSYRFHDQNGVDFFTTRLAVPFAQSAPHTADSDLAPLTANEWSIGLATVRRRGPLRAWAVSAELLRYVRSNDLQITTVSLAIGRAM